MKNNKFKIGQKVNWFETPCKIKSCEYSEWSGWFYDLTIDDGSKQLRSVTKIEEEYLSFIK